MLLYLDATAALPLMILSVMALMALAGSMAWHQRQAQAMSCAQVDRFAYDPARDRLQVGRLARHWIGQGNTANDALPQLLAQNPAQHQALQQALRSPHALTFNLHLAGHDGQLRVLQLRSPAQAREGARRAGSIQDITALWQARHLLDQHQSNINALAHNLPDALLIVQDTQVVHTNPAAVQLTGRDALHSDAFPLQQVLPALGGQLPQHAQSQHLALHDAGGQRIDTLVTLAPFLYQGRPSHLLLIRDITRVEATRRQLQASNQELQAMAQRLFRVQEDERQAISRDLHDDIGQSITAMKLAAHAAIDEPDALRRREDLELLLEMADQTVGRLRDLSTLLRPPQLDALGLEAALSWQMRTILRNCPIQYTVQVPPLSRRPAALCEQTCFRIAQESLTNIVRHAHAGTVQLSLQELDDGWMVLHISDDGDGFDADGPRGLGLAVMRERALGAGGRLHIDTAPGAGTRITCHLPFSPADHSGASHGAA